MSYSSELLSAVLAGDTQLPLDTTLDFLPGTDAIIGTEIVSIVDVDDDAAVLHLASPLLSGYDEEAEVKVHPVIFEKVAHIIIEEEDEELIARVPFTMYDRLATGTREPGTEEVVAVDFDQDELVIEDALGLLPIVDGSVIDPGTLPPAEPAPSDGLTPDASPTPTVMAAISALSVTWLAELNADFVTYEVHVSPLSTFVPTPETFYGETPGTAMFINNLPSGAPLVAGTNYYVRIVAKDEDGSAPPSVAGSNSPVTVGTTTIGPGSITSTQIQDNAVTTPKLAANAVETDKLAANSVTSIKIAALQILASHIAAGAITADKLEAVLVLATTIVAGTRDGPRVEFGVVDDLVDDEQRIGLTAYNPLGEPTLRADGETGDVAISGTFEFGDPANPSGLLKEDVIELNEQAVGLATPQRVQSDIVSKATTTSITLQLPNYTRVGRWAVLTVQVFDNGTVPTVSNSDITGGAAWTLRAATAHTSNRFRVYTFTRPITSRWKTITVTASSNAERLRAELAEYANISSSGFEACVPAQGTGTAVSVAATSTQNNDLMAGQFTYRQNASASVTSTDPAGFNLIGERQAASEIGSRYFDGVAFSTGLQTMSSTLGSSRDWVAHLLLLKASDTSAGPNPPDADKVAIFGLNVGGRTRLHAKDELGNMGSVVLGTSNEVWDLEYVTRSFAPGSINAHSGGIEVIPIVGLKVGDNVMFAGTTSGQHYLQMRTNHVCAVDDEIQLRYYNSDTSALNPGTVTIGLWIRHRS